MTDGYEAIVGLECHAQLRTESKMFCACPVVQDAEPNVAVCEICLAHPGTLPTLNDRAVKLGVRAAVALGCEVHATSVFARKHYFYPDLPKGYQITQHDRPLATGGAVHALGRDFRVARLHLEEDAGKMLHGPDGTVVDWNRAGVPLVEIVSEPDLRTPEEAEAWLRALHRALVEAGVCLGDMEKGHLRCDVNVSVHRPGEPWGPKVEVKNVNSFRFVGRAVRFEIARQIAEREAGRPVARETRTWTGTRTASLRRKEEAADYRYFPDPDLPPLVVSPAEIAAEAAALPGVPLGPWFAAQDAARADDWKRRYGLNAADVAALVAEPDVAAFFAAAVDAGGDPRAMAGWARTELLRRIHSDDRGLGALAPHRLVQVQAMLDGGSINRDGAKTLLDALVAADADPGALAAERGLRQVSDEAALRAIVQDLIVRHPGEVAKYRAGNKGVAGFFMGRLMAATNRTADPQVAARLLREALESTNEGMGT